MKYDKSLNSGLRTGDYSCYRALFKRCYGKLLSFSNSIIKDKQAAEDIVQEQFMKLWSNKHQIDDRMCVESYLYVMTRNAALNYLKSHSKLVGIPEVESHTASQIDIDRRIDAAIIQNRLFELIGKMPPQRKKIFTMSKIEGMSSIDIANILGLSVKTVDRHLSIAKAYIKENIYQIL